MTSYTIITFCIILSVIAVFIFIMLRKRTVKICGRFSSFDENVQFSLYRPSTIVPERWYPMIVFAHLSKLGGTTNDPDPIEEVTRQARQALGGQFKDFEKLNQDSAQAVPKAGEITIVPSVYGIEFNPSCRTFKWLEDIHREEFRFRALRSKDKETLRGNIAIFLGSILLADINLSIQVESSQSTTVNVSSIERSHTRPYRRIFASYSHKDSAIVNQFQNYAQAFGDRFLRDILNLRSGEVWDERIIQMIENADVFQLFWSSNSMRSPFVKQEWQYALSLNRKGFIRPTYWEVPMPESSHEGLPPDELKRLHFQRIAFAESMDDKHEQNDPEARKRLKHNRVGLATSVLIPFFLPIFMYLNFASPFKLMRILSFLSPEINTTNVLLEHLWIAPMFACLWVSLIILLILILGTIENFWDKFLKIGKSFWFFTTVFLFLLFCFPALRYAFTHGVSRQTAPYIFTELMAASSWWLSYAWIRWLFLPFFIKCKSGNY